MMMAWGKEKEGARVEERRRERERERERVEEGENNR